ncbi:tRNA (guanosine(46)-N7)-methyltransferase TrmB [Sandaracinobacteroides sp. A072]|uniref:tRNA (guanosine(46)-N7)-methyltransferase TrmB n=1 Tax=Sandaracinobacteroides sp. A072 TaxID=3461146 RepID=UPI00404355D4
MNDPLSIRRLYGRAQGHALRANAQRLVDELLPRIAIPPQGPLDARRLFGDDRPLVLEIGFGKGEHLAFQAARRPDRGFIGAEPYVNGVAGLLAEVDSHGLSNVRILKGDAIDVLDRLPDASLSAVYLLHPDPWPKARHAKRRFVNPGPVGLVARRLKPGGEFRIATDHVGYMRHTLSVMQHMDAFEWTATSRDDWENVPEDWPDTRFAMKARALGHDVWRLIYRRR